MHKESDFRRLFEGRSSGRYEILEDVDSDIGKGSFRGFSTYSSASNFFTDESSISERNFEGSIVREETEGDKILEIE